MPWRDQARSTPVVEVLQALGLSAGRSRSWGPCPACDATTRGSSDRRGPLGLKGNVGWRCHRCEQGGDGLSAVSLHLGGFAGVRDWYSSRGWAPSEDLGERSMVKKRTHAPACPTVEAVSSSAERPPLVEVSALWAASWASGKPCPWELTDECRAVLAYVKRRGFGGSPACRILPPDGHPSWWPGGGYRLAVHAYCPNGAPASVHARDCLNGGGPKTKWPRGYTAHGLLMAGPKGAAFLRGEIAPGRVVAVEGCTGLIGATKARPDAVVLAFTSGGASAFGQVRWPEGTVVEIATDIGDVRGTGDLYAQKIRAALPRHIKATRRLLGA